MSRERLDVLLVARGFMPTRTQAQRAIVAGDVYVAGKQECRPAAQVAHDADIQLRDDKPPYVSRGGLKLAKALKTFSVHVSGKIALDVGASTGGFTDCLLQHGAAHVYAVDVGYGQMAESLRQDPRVSVLEGVNIRYLAADALPAVDIATIDVSFISLEKVLPAVAAFITAQGDLVALIKPQFEAGRAGIGKRGVVRDPQVHCQVLYNVLNAALANSLAPQGLTFSPITGPQGNIEFLLHAKKGATVGSSLADTVARTVEAAHKELVS